MNWTSFGIGAGLAALAGALHYAAALPAPYGAIATTVAVMLAAYMKSPLNTNPPPAAPPAAPTEASK